MSELNLISPLLDNMDMGEPISDRGGVRACPAMAKDTDDKYIVKIISLPATPTQLDALLLSGAYTEKADALSYFKELADGIAAEVEILEKLSALEGFTPFIGCQIEPMVENDGYDVYLLTPYRKSLDRLFKGSSMTHLGALNLGLDLCAALAVCRRAGYLYADLKPANIYLTGDNTFKIGDIGFMKLDALRYASLPDRCRSAYTAPEITDAFSSLNTTMDVYAVGLILYQAFNGGQLPDEANGELPPPDYADYEMAEIILKACAAAPEDRWQDPIELGQALVSYMQRNGAHDTPIVPAPVAVDPVAADDVPVGSEAECNRTDNIEDAPTDQASIPTADASVPQTEEADGPAADTDTALVSSEAGVANDGADQQLEGAASAGPVYSEDDFGNLSFLDDIQDETLPGVESEDIDYEQVSIEVSDILNQADDLIAHPTPDPVIPPDPIEVPMPDPIILEPELEQEEEANQTLVPEDVPEHTSSREEADAVAVSEEADADKPEKTKRHWLRNTLIVLLILALLGGGFCFYKYYYMQLVEDIQLIGDEDALTVLITSDIDDTLLRVVCSDAHGNQHIAPVKDGIAVFDSLAPNSAYNIKVEILGFHKLTGDTSTAYTTPEQTNIAQFSAVTGAEDGSVILGFTVEGRDADQWKIVYSAVGEDPREVIFSGHMYTLNGLTIGAVYTFELIPTSDLNFTGSNRITHVASNLIRPQQLAVESCVNGKLAVSWKSPTDTPVVSWAVHCYNQKGFDKTIVTEELKAVFEGITDTDDYTVEVTAAGMSVSERVFVPENSITVSNLAVTSETAAGLSLSWNTENHTPENGWIVQYSVEGSPVTEIRCQQANVNISPYIPGSVYNIKLLTAGGVAVLGGAVQYTTQQAEDFAGYGVNADEIGFNMCKTPSYSGWDRYDLSDSDFTTTFGPSEDASFLVRLYTEYDVSSDEIITLYVIRDESGKLISTATQTGTWSSMWYRNYGEFDIPALPSAPGNYTVTIYFNAAYAGQKNFTITN